MQKPKVREKKRKGAMTVAEAGRKGGLRVRDERGLGYYEQIGRMGGLKVRALIEAGRRAIAQSQKRTKKSG